jgi:hypothetical protein
LNLRQTYLLEFFHRLSHRAPIGVKAGGQISFGRQSLGNAVLSGQNILNQATCNLVVLSGHFSVLRRSHCSSKLNAVF